MSREELLIFLEENLKRYPLDDFELQVVKRAIQTQLLLLGYGANEEPHQTPLPSQAMPMDNPVKSRMSTKDTNAYQSDSIELPVALIRHDDDDTFIRTSESAEEDQSGPSNQREGNSTMDIGVHDLKEVVAASPVANRPPGILGGARRATPEDATSNATPLTPSESLKKVLDGTSELGFDDFAVEREIGAGGMGRVLLAKHKESGLPVALKVLMLNEGRESESFLRFEREVSTMQALEHENIVKVFGQGEHQEGLFMAMELVNGLSLPELLGTYPQGLPVEAALELILQLIDALASAHEKGIVHRDLKPANVMVTQDGHVKLMDFGIAKILGDNGLTKTGMVVGTADYMSPEQTTGKPVDHRSDLFCAGLIFYTVLTGRSYFRRDIAADTMLAIAKGPPPRIFETAPGVPQYAEEVSNALLQHNAAKRPSSTQEYSEKLKAKFSSLRGHFRQVLADTACQRIKKAQHTQLQLSTSWVEKALRLREANPEAACLYAYRGALISTSDPRAGEVFQSLSQHHGYNFAKPQNIQLATALEELGKKPYDEKLLKSVLEPLAKEGNWHRWACYMRRRIEICSQEREAHKLWNELNVVDPDYRLV